MVKTSVPRSSSRATRRCVENASLSLASKGTCVRACDNDDDEDAREEFELILARVSSSSRVSSDERPRVVLSIRIARQTSLSRARGRSRLTTRLNADADANRFALTREDAEEAPCERP